MNLRWQSMDNLLVLNRDNVSMFWWVLFFNVRLYRGLLFVDFIYFILFYVARFSNHIVQGESKKVWFAAPVAKLYLFCATLLYGVLSIFFLKILIFFGTSLTQKKSANLFFLTKSKAKKNKNVQINCFYRNLKF